MAANLDRAETSLTAVSDIAYIRGIDSSGNSVRISKADLASVLGANGLLSGYKSGGTAQGTGTAQAVAGIMQQGFCMVGIYSDDGEDVLVNIGFVPSSYSMSKTTQLIKRGNNINELVTNEGGTLAAYPTTDANKEYTFFVIKLI